MKVVFRNDVIDKFIERSLEIIRKDTTSEKIAIIGIKTGGFYLAQRIFKVLSSEDPRKYLLGSVDITFWRDDLSRNPYPLVKGTEINFPIDDIPVYLIDDVIYTGRTTRAGLCELFDYGRPIYVKLLCVVNRIGREVPIHPDYFAFQIKLEENQILEVVLKEKGFPVDCGVVVEEGEKLSPETLKLILTE
jgi:pyrimidine operon attenuation protein/uracil phosphoribosyltransferase